MKKRDVLKLIGTSIAGLTAYGLIVDSNRKKLKSNLHKSYGLYEKYFKRMIDVTGAATGIVLLSPVLGVTSLVIRTTMGSPVVFKQKRPGVNGDIFELYKFRSMKDPTDIEGNKISDEERVRIIKEKGPEFVTPDEQRITKFGDFIRRYSIDELPELFNILKGDMAFIGPRPLAVIYLPYYTDEEKHRHDVRPGLSGLAQVHGRNSISWEEKFKYDLQYVNRITFTGDVKIFIDSIITALKHDNIGEGNEKPESFCTVRQREWDEENT